MVTESNDSNQNSTDVTGVKSDVVNVNEYEVLAKKKLPKMAFDFYAGGAEDEWTLKQNKAAFKSIRLRPRILVDVSNVDLSTTVLGFPISMPILIAPTAMHKLADPEGELATARAATAEQTIMILSYSSTCSIEEVAATSDSVRFFQLYMYKQRIIAEHIIRRAEKAGYKAIVLTCDTPVIGRREADIKNRFSLPLHLTIKNFDGLVPLHNDVSRGSALEAFAAAVMDRSLNWKDIKWMQSITNLPIFLKGVLTGEDAALAVEAGVAGIIVSNHGGRQLDYSSPSIIVLEEIVSAVCGRIPVLLDGGIRRGTDIFKALALGASAVLIGRPILFGLAVDGEMGVKNVLQMLRNELELTMALAGCCSLKDISRSHIQIGYENLFAKL
eukprot:c26747_g1_i1 orf=584-1738(+)